ncbi:uncharacterized protein LOC129599968 [Paramacrobiotus metropolitanus]|uniref:uncharacterized protein LOC129599968 n=1 Tax=Paramacrobiotus metropolitanus TaxID=2943436 RepID=UPI002445ADA8|nr:uncharacterized protein LOC129599968 [Paramacrobiotus metropolitanus]
MYGGIHQANGVDVVDADGLIRYGRVVDLADNGFFVDFRCPTGRRRFFPFDSNVFLTRRSRHLVGFGMGEVYAQRRSMIPVEVLMRASLSSPWKWFPAEMINLARGKWHDRYDVAVVNWGNNLARTDVVPCAQIRQRVPQTWWNGVDNAQHRVALRDEYGGPVVGRRVGRNSFIMRRMTLTGKHYSVSVEKLQKTLQNSTNCFDEMAERETAFLETRGGFMWYLDRRGNDYMLEDPEKPFSCEHDQDLEAFHRMVGEYLPSNANTYKASSAGSALLDDIKVLSVELWLEVFFHLNTLMQNKLRGVCSTWDSILQSPLLTANIVTGFPSWGDMNDGTII